MRGLKIAAIVAFEKNRGIGLNNSIPWYMPEDLRHFKQLTSGSAVLMGRKTYDSLPEKFKPLPNRQNFVVSRTLKPGSLGDSVSIVSDPVDFIRMVKGGKQSVLNNQLWIVGGQRIYEVTLGFIDEIYVTRINQSYQADAFFPDFEEGFRCLAIEEHDGYSFEHFGRK